MYLHTKFHASTPKCKLLLKIGSQQLYYCEQLMSATSAKRPIIVPSFKTSARRLVIVPTFKTSVRTKVSLSRSPASSTACINTIKRAKSDVHRWHLIIKIIIRRRRIMTMMMMIFFFFFCVPQLYLWSSPFLGEIFAYVTVF